MDILSLKKNHLFVSRGATGIYLILATNQVRNKKILFPANICYAAVYPALYAGYTPIFCDVDKHTGNVSFDVVKEYTDIVSVVLLPHMYGNPISDITMISDLCKRRNILLIEDCASAMGAEVDGRICGSWGDYAIFSTGYSKTIDIGSGGIVITDRDIWDMAQCYKQLPEKSIQDERNDAFFSKLYRLIRNNSEQTISTYIWRGLKNHLRTVYIHNEPGIDERIKAVLGKLEEVVSKRRAAVDIYVKNLRTDLGFEIYPFSEGAVPWRFSLLVNTEVRRKMIDYLLEHNIPVSDWYPVVTPIFGEENKFYGASALGDRIINFPLMLEEEEIQEICWWVNKFSTDYLVSTVEAK